MIAVPTLVITQTWPPSGGNIGFMCASVIIVGVVAGL